MKKFILIILFLGLFVSLFSQKNLNFGIIAGTSYYLGDINHSRQFYRPGPSGGIIYRFNFNQRYAIRGHVVYARIAGNENDFDYVNHPDRVAEQDRAVFNTSLIDGGLCFEINFMPFRTYSDKRDISSYVSFGLGGGFPIGSNIVNATPNSNPVPYYCFPFGIGLKTNLNKRLSGGVEWGFRKTFTDRLDGVTNSVGESSLLHNNDWYSVFGVFITYKFINFAVDCPAYK